MNKDELEFVTLTIGALAERLGLKMREVFNMLKNSGILNDYLVPCYNVLHTFSLSYVVDDVVNFMKRKGLIA